MCRSDSTPPQQQALTKHQTHTHTRTHPHPPPNQAAHQQQAAAYGLIISRQDVVDKWFRPTGKNAQCVNKFGNVLERFHREARKEAGTTFVFVGVH